MQLRLVISAILLFFVPAASIAQKHPAKQAPSLQDQYDAAVRLQQAGHVDQAALQYRQFLSAAQATLAAGYAGLGEYPKASALLDKALLLTPESTSLRMTYAHMAFDAGDLPRAERLTRAVLQEPGHNPQELAQAHAMLGRTLLKMNKDQDARKELEAAVALDPTFENGYNLAVACLDLDDEKCAVQVFSEMEKSFGDTPEIHMNFGRAYGESDAAARAVTEFKKVIAENPRYPGAHYALAAAILTTGEDDEKVQAAVAALKQELEISPQDALTYAGLGKIAAVHQQLREAEKYLKRATELDPKNPDAYLYLGQMYFNNDRIPEAEAALKRSIELTTDPARNRYQVQKAHFLLGRVYMRQHQEDKAKAEMQISRSFGNQVLSQDKSKLAGLLNNPLPVTSTGTPQQADTPAKPQAHEANPEDARKLDSFRQQVSPAIADAYNNLGVIAATASKYPEALSDFQEAAVWNPAEEGLDLNLGRAAFMSSNFEAAIPPLSRYVSTHPDDSGTRGALGMSQFMAHDYNGCVKTLAGVEDKLASTPQMQFVYAVSLVKTGQVAAGTQRLEALKTSRPEIGDVHRGLGEALALQGRKSEAIAELHTAIQLNANDAEARYDLGMTSMDTGDAATAVAQLEAAVRLSPSNPQFHKDLAAAYKRNARNEDAERELRAYDALRTPPASPAHPN